MKTKVRQIQQLASGCTDNESVNDLLGKLLEIEEICKSEEFGFGDHVDLEVPSESDSKVQGYVIYIDESAMIIQTRSLEYQCFSDKSRQWYVNGKEACKISLRGER